MWIVDNWSLGKEVRQHLPSTYPVPPMIYYGYTGLDGYLDGYSSMGKRE